MENKILYTLKNNAAIFLEYVREEFTNILNYFNALLIGVSINYLSGTLNRPLTSISISPFIIPLLIQSLSKSIVKYNYRHMKRLLQLPSEREDPVFIMDDSGNIILAPGLTNKLFTSHNINNIADFITKDDFNLIMDYKGAEFFPKNEIEAYSPITSQWYEVRIKCITKKHKYIKEYLVWFINITAKRQYEKKLENIQKLTSKIYQSIQKNISDYDIFYDFAHFMLQNDYNGVFITTMDKKQNLTGYVYKKFEDRIIQSHYITIPSASQAPVTISRKESKVVSASILQFKNRIEFEEKYPFDPRVKEFLGFEINNFINFHEKNVSIIVFNKNNQINKYDKIFMEIIVNQLKTVNDLVSCIL